MMTDEIRGVLALKERMEERVVGQAPGTGRHLPSYPDVAG